MAQQINLHSPILLSTKRYFSALAMAKGLVAIAIGAAALCAWMTIQTQALRKDLLATERSNVSEKQLLMNAIAINPALGTSTTALEQNLKALEQTSARRREALAELTRGTVREGRSHSALLRLVANTVPQPVWLTEVNGAAGRLEISGMTLDPSVLRPWIAQLAADPQLAGQQLATVHVERANPLAPGAVRPIGVPALNRNLEAWAFTIASGEPKPPAQTASGAAP